MNGAGIDIRAIIGLLRRRALLLALAVLGCVAIALVVLAVTPARYTASALVMVEPEGRAAFQPERTAGSGEGARVASAVALLRSDAVLRAVVTDHDLADDTGFGATAGWTRTLAGLMGTPSGPDDPAAAVERALDALRSAATVRQLDATYVISTSVDARDPVKAARLANAVSRTFIRQQLQGEIDGALAASRAIDTRLRGARAAIVEAETAFDRALGRAAAQWDEARAPELAALRDTLEAAVKERATLRDRLATQRTAPDQGGRRDAGVLSVSATAGDTRPLQDRISTLSVRVDELRTQVREAVVSRDLPTADTAELYALQQAAALARSQHQALLERASDLRIEAGLELADSRLVSPAVAPAAPSGPNASLILALAGLTGVSMGLGLAVARETYVGGFVDRDQLAAGLGVEAVIEVPRQRDTGAGVRGLPDMMTAAPLSRYAESFRRVRAALDRMFGLRTPTADPGTGSVLMVCSAEPEEGKTTIALSLGRAYALAGYRTLLVDCDLRRPGVHALLGLSPTSGLRDYLEGEGGETLSAMIALDSATGLSVLTGVGPSEAPTDQLVSGSSLESLLAAARRQFEVVILDTPPAGSVVDPFYIARHADAMAFVVQWAATAQGDARAALATLREGMVDADRVVAVLNRHEALGRAYRDPYSRYYEKG